MLKNSKDIINALKTNGWKVIRTKGSHVQMKHDKTGKMVTIPHPKKDLPIGTVKAIYRSTELQ